jgi:uncharacterized membrane protein
LHGRRIRRCPRARYLALRRVVWLGSALYAVVYFVLGWDRYATYHSGADLGLFMQTIASALESGGFRNTLEGGNHFIFHFSPILYLCAPWVRLARSALALVAIQAAAGALVAPGLYEIASRRNDERSALAIAAIGWVYPPLAGVTFTDFHEDGLVPAATVWLLWALDARRLRLAALFAALLLATKEDQGLILAATGLGLVALFARRDPARARFGAGLTCVSLAVFGLYFAVVRPLAGATSAWVPLHFYGLGGLAARGPTAPLFSLGRLTYLIEAFGPLLAVPLLSPVVLGALPGLAECLLSRESLTYTMGQHYAAVWIGYVLVAYAQAASRLGVWARRGPLIACLLVLAIASPTHWGHFLRLPNRHDAVLNRFVASLPAGARVGTYDEVYAHLGFDPGAQIGLDPLPRFALFDYTYRSTEWEERERPRFEHLLATGVYRVVRREDGVILASKRS